MKGKLLLAHILIPSVDYSLIFTSLTCLDCAPPIEYLWTSFLTSNFSITILVNFDSLQRAMIHFLLLNPNTSVSLPKWLFNLSCPMQRVSRTEFSLSCGSLRNHLLSLCFNLLIYKKETNIEPPSKGCCGV